MLEATERKLEKVRERVARGRLKGEAAIGVRVGRVLNKYKVGKHFTLEITDNRFEFHRLEEQIGAEAALDGIYVIRTSVPKKRMSAADAVRNYKALENVERAFRAKPPDVCRPSPFAPWAAAVWRMSVNPISPWKYEHLRDLS